MSDDTTARLALPLLHPGQAQKEMSHNEALARLDLAVQACATAAGAETPPMDPAPGACWILGDDPEGEWAGQAHAVAGWTAGGWRFLAPAEGMRLWVAEAGGFALYSDGEWAVGATHGRLIVDGEQVVGGRLSGIEAPAGGAVIDFEARTAIAEILLALEEHGLIEPS